MGVRAFCGWGVGAGGGGGEVAEERGITSPKECVCVCPRMPRVLEAVGGGWRMGGKKNNKIDGNLSHLSIQSS